MPIPTSYWIVFAVDVLLSVSGIIVACVFARRAVWPAVLTIVALTLRLAVTVGFLVATLHMRRVLDDGFDDPTGATSLLRTIQIVAAVAGPVEVILLVAAAIGWRSGWQAIPIVRVAQGAFPATQSVEGCEPRTTPAQTWAIAPISKAPYFAGIYLPAGVSLVLSAIAWLILLQRGSPTASLMFSMPAMLFSVVTIVFLMFLFHRLWHTIQMHSIQFPQGTSDIPVARTTPARAIGYLFIPLFNFYWVFVAWFGLARDTNALLDRRSITSARAAEGLAIAMCVLMLLSIIPFVGMVFGLAGGVCMLVYLVKAIDAANALRAVGAVGPSAMHAERIVPSQWRASTNADGIADVALTAVPMGVNAGAPSRAWLAIAMWTLATVIGTTVGQLVVDAIDPDPRWLGMLFPIAIILAQYGALAIARQHRPLLLPGALCIVPCAYLAYVIDRTSHIEMFSYLVFGLGVALAWSIALSRSWTHAIAWLAVGTIAVVASMHIAETAQDMARDLVPRRRNGSLAALMRSLLTVVPFGLVIAVQTAPLVWWLYATAKTSKRAPETSFASASMKPV